MLKLHKLVASLPQKLLRSRTTYRVCAMVLLGAVVCSLDVTSSTDVTNYSFAKTSYIADVDDNGRLSLTDGNESVNSVLNEKKADFVNREAEDEIVEFLAANDKVTDLAARSEGQATIEQQEVAVTVSSSEVINNLGLEISAQDYDALCRIVQAEAGNQDEIGKIMVANVIINRVLDSRFPSTIYDVVYAGSDGDTPQFSPTASEDFEYIQASESTIACVERALAGEDYSQGALYFTSCYEDTSWFNTALTFITQEGAHYFYK